MCVFLVLLLNYKSKNKRLNLSRSQQLGHSATYNTPFRYLSRMQRIYPLKQFELWLNRTDGAALRIVITKSPSEFLPHGLGPPVKGSYEYASQLEGRLGMISSLSSMDSDLEAFSHNPTHDSFAALPVQATAITKYVNQRFLSY